MPGLGQDAAPGMTTGGDWSGAQPKTDKEKGPRPKTRPHSYRSGGETDS